MDNIICCDNTKNNRILITRAIYNFYTNAKGWDREEHTSTIFSFLKCCQFIVLFNAGWMESKLLGSELCSDSCNMLVIEYPAYSAAIFDLIRVSGNIYVTWHCNYIYSNFYRKSSVIPIAAAQCCDILLCDVLHS
ncbi:hypothetical protein ACJX0J_037934 [Zea mays]